MNLKLYDKSMRVRVREDGLVYIPKPIQHKLNHAGRVDVYVDREERAFAIKPNRDGAYSITGGRLFIKGIVRDLDIVPDAYDAEFHDGGLLIRYKKTGDAE